MIYSVFADQHGDVYINRAGDGTTEKWQIALDAVLPTAQSIRDQAAQIEASVFETGDATIDTTTDTLTICGTPSNLYRLARDLEGSV